MDKIEIDRIYEQMKASDSLIARSFTKLSRLVLSRSPFLVIENERRILASLLADFPCAPDGQESCVSVEDLVKDSRHNKDEE